MRDPSLGLIGAVLGGLLASSALIWSYHHQEQQDAEVPEVAEAAEECFQEVNIYVCESQKHYRWCHDKYGNPEKAIEQPMPLALRNSYCTY